MYRNVIDYVNEIFKRKEDDVAFRANMRHASSENLEWKAWNLIGRFSFIDLKDTSERKTYILIGSSISNSKQKNNGCVKLGEALSLATKEEKKSQEKNKYKLPARFARVLSCSSLDELINVLRSTLTLISSKEIELDYADLLTDILNFQYEDSILEIKAKWVSNYLSKEMENDSK